MYTVLGNGNRNSHWSSQFDDIVKITVTYSQYRVPLCLKGLSCVWLLVIHSNLEVTSVSTNNNPQKLKLNVIAAR